MHRLHGVHVPVVASQMNCQALSNPRDEQRTGCMPGAEFDTKLIEQRGQDEILRPGDFPERDVSLYLAHHVCGGPADQGQAEV